MRPTGESPRTDAPEAVGGAAVGEFDAATVLVAWTREFGARRRQTSEQIIRRLRGGPLRDPQRLRRVRDRLSPKRSANGKLRQTVFAANQPAPVMDVSAADLHGARETKCTPSRPSSEKPSAAPDETSIRKRGAPQRWYWSESI